MEDNYLKKISESLKSIDTNIDSIADPYNSEHMVVEVDLEHDDHINGFGEFLKVLKGIEESLFKIEQHLSIWSANENRGEHCGINVAKALDNITSAIHEFQESFENEKKGDF